MHKMLMCNILNNGNMKLVTESNKQNNLSQVELFFIKSESSKVEIKLLNINYLH